MSARAWQRRRNKARPRWILASYGRLVLRDRYSVTWWEPSNRPDWADDDDSMSAEETLARFRALPEPEET